MRWAPALIDRIRALHRAGGVEIRWCGTWCAEVGQVEQLFALPRPTRAWSDRLVAIEIFVPASVNEGFGGPAEDADPHAPGR